MIVRDYSVTLHMGESPGGVSTNFERLTVTYHFTKVASPELAAALAARRAVRTFGDLLLFDIEVRAL